MKCDLLLAGVGGQGVLSTAALLAKTASDAGLHVKQSELHGMSQRGGSVLAHLRVADAPIHSELVSPGRADILLGFEPLEAARDMHYMSEGGCLASNTEPIELDSGYPDLEGLIERLRGFAGSRLVNCREIARAAGAPVAAANMVLLGVVADRLPLTPEQIEGGIAERFGKKGEAVVAKNVAAFRAGMERGA